MIPRRFFWLFDLVILIATFWVAYRLTPSVAHLFALGAPLWAPWIQELFAPSALAMIPPLRDFTWVLLVMMPSTILFLGLFGNHRPLLVQSRTRIVVGSVAASLVSSGLVTLILFALKSPEWSRIFIFSFTLLSGLVLAAYRLALRQYFMVRRDTGNYANNVLLIGSPASIEWMMHYFSDGIPQTEYRLIGYLCLDPDQPCPSLNGESLNRLGSVQELGNLLIHRPISEVIVIQPAIGGAWLKQVIEDCDYFRMALRIVPEALLFNNMHDLKVFYRNELLHLPAVVLAPPDLDSELLFVKRLFDIVVSAALLVLFTPLFLLVTLAIKLTTPHLPVFYPWRVVGYQGKPFTGYKFTTMVADADERKAQLADHNEMSGPVFKIKDDPRITPLGRFLRKYSINELPQLWSVLKGDMSLVGPRPAGPDELERYELWHKRKLSIRPGITCLWQIRGRNKISNFDDWVRMDLEYIDHWSLWLDFRILVRTAWVVIIGTGS